MKKLCLVFILLLINFFPLTAQVGIENYKNQYKILPFEEIIKHYPFNKTTKIALLSYNLDTKYPASLKADTAKARDSVSSKDFLFVQDLIKHNLKHVSQVKILDLDNTYKLTDLLINLCKHKDLGGTYSGPRCFYPRNAILFYSEEGNVIEFIEISFECLAVKVSNTQNKENILSIQIMNDKNLCTSFYNFLSAFFKNNGIQTTFNYTRENSP